MAILEDISGSQTLREAWPKIEGNDHALNADIARVEAEADAADASLQTQISDEQQARMLADSSHAAALIAHAASQIALAAVSGMTATNLQAAVAELAVQISNIVASAGSGNTEVVDGRLGADGSARATLGTLIREIHAKLLAAAVQQGTLKHGMNLITTDQAGPLDAVVYGQTRVNLLWSDGNCESLTPFTTDSGTVELSTTQKKSGTNSIKITAATSGAINKNYSYALDSTKQYILAGWVFIESWSAGTVQIRLQDSDGLTDRYVATANTATIGSWQFVYVKIPTANALVGSGFKLRIGGGATRTWVAYFDDIRLYEVSATDYTAIGSTITTTSSPSIDDVFPYVDGVKHVDGVGIMKIGKNMLPPVNELTFTGSSLDLTSPYSFTSSATSAGGIGSYDIAVGAGVQLTLSCTLTPSVAYAYLRFFNEAGSTISTSSSITAASNKVTVTTPTGTVRVRVVFERNAGGNATYSDWMLVLGSTSDLPSSFVPRNDDYHFAPIRLASSVDGSARDFYNMATKTVLRRWKTGIVLSGSLTFAAANDLVGYKEISIPHSQFSSLVQNNNLLNIVKFNGSPLAVRSPITSPDQCRFGSSNLLISIADSESGWGEDYTPSTAEQSALMNGWKMNNGTFGQPYNGIGTKTWTRWDATNNTGSVTTVPTTLASGYPGYVMDYVLATLYEEHVPGAEGTISLHQGGNQVELMTGVVVREAVTPYLSSGSYYINSQHSSANLKNRTASIIAVYKDAENDPGWSKVTSGTLNGPGRAILPQERFDVTKPYFATYLILDKYLKTVNIVDCTMSYNTNPQTVISALVRKLADAETLLSVVANTYARRAQGPWLAPTFINAWVNYGGSDATAAYYKDDFGLVHIRGRIKSGTIGQTAFVLPAGYRPDQPLRLAVDSNGAHGVITIGTDGTVTPSVGTNTDVSINVRPFRAGA